MSALEGKTVLVIDNGLFLPLAFRLAREAAHVMFYAPGESPFPKLADAVIGDGFSEIERVSNLFGVISLKQPDLVVVPDVGHKDLQLQLQRMGIPVWGSRSGDRLELHRQWLKKFQADAGMDVPPYHVIHGLAALWKFLEPKENWDCYLKISRFRGDMETHHFISPKVDLVWFQQQAAKWGPLSDNIAFIVEKKIEAVAEIGFDGFCIDGKFPAVAVQGIEGKDKVYIGAVTKYEDLPEELTDVNAALSEFLRQSHYRNFFSTEVRVAEDGTAYLTDPTCRHASPAGECLDELITNWGDIMVAGAQGEMVEPEYVAKFAVQAMIDHPGDPMQWRTLEVPEEVRDWVKIYFCCQQDGVIAIPPFPWNHDSIGSVLGMGDTIQEAMDHLKENVEALSGQDLEIKTVALADVIADIEKAEEAGMEFTDQPVPPPESVLEKH